MVMVSALPPPPPLVKIISGSGYNQILFADNAIWYHFLEDAMPGPDQDFTTLLWHHTCFTWSSGRQVKELYLNGKKITEETTDENSKVPINGILVLGQDQDSLGGGFHISQSFGGEIYRLEILKTKLSADKVAEMYEAGMCEYPTRSVDVVLDWEDFLNAERSGEVKEIPAGCSKWDVLESFVGQEITPNMIEFLDKYF